MSEEGKIVIFIHAANQFIIDGSITANAVYIKMADEECEESGKSLIYYKTEIKNAEMSDKKYLIIEYEPAIGSLIKSLFRKKEEINFNNWMFLAFFHNEYMAPVNDRDTIMSFLGFNYILRYTIPAGYVLTANDLQKIDDDLAVPDTREEFIKKFGKSFKPYFPHYKVDDDIFKEFLWGKLF